MNVRSFAKTLGILIVAAGAVAVMPGEQVSATGQAVASTTPQSVPST